MKTAAEIAAGFAGGDRNRAGAVMRAAVRETSLKLAGEAEQILDMFPDPAEAVLTIRSWVKATRETAEEGN